MSVEDEISNISIAVKSLEGPTHKLKCYMKDFKSDILVVVKENTSKSHFDQILSFFKNVYDMENIRLRIIFFKIVKFY